MDMTQIGKTLRTLREKAGLTNRELGESLDVTPSYISYIENGKRIPTLPLLERMTEHLGGRLVIDVITSTQAPPVDVGLSPEDRALLRQIAALLPRVSDPVERKLIVRQLELAVERDRDRGTG